MRKRSIYPSLEGKTVAVSGSTGGIGSALCQHVARLGGSLLLLDRNPQKVSALIDRLREEHPSLSARHVPLDLENADSVSAAVGVLKSCPPDVLILNAGAYHIPRRKCADGHDNIFKINFLSPYTIAKALLPDMERRGGRIVVVGSLAHFVARLDPSDPELTKRRPSAEMVYGNAKRMLMFALSRRAGAGESLSVVHPGITPTGITGGYPRVIQAIIKYPMRLVFMPPRRAAECILRGIFEPTGEGEWIGPRVFGIWGKPKKRALRSYTRAEADAVIALVDGETALNKRNQRQT